MFKRNQITAVMAASVILSFSAASVAQETEGGQVTVEVSNGFTLANPTAITFGTIRATQSAAGAAVTDTAYLLIEADGTTVTESPGTGTNDGVISSLVDGAPAEYTIADAAPFTNLTLLTADDATYIPFNATAVVTGRFGIVGMGAVETGGLISPIELTTSGGGATDVLYFTAETAQTLITGNGTTSGDPYDADNPNLRTDGNGEVGLNIGGYLYMLNAATASPSDGAYTAAYEITVSY